MEFRILGPLEVWDGQRAVPVGAAKHRALLAVLLINANRAVAPSRLIELLWDHHPPSTAANAVQVYIAHLRRMLEPDRVPGSPYKVLVRRPEGYELRIQPAQVDALQFERLVHEASRARVERQWQLTAERLGAALALWRGRALAEFVSERFALSEIARLEELRLRALEERIDADLNLGRHAELIPELQALVAENPLRERLCGQLMLALYRCGLQAQASDVYYRTRARLVEELGMEPGPLLERLFRDILRRAGSLEARAVGSAPHNLQHPLTSFVGRDAELAQLTRRLESVRLLTLTGPGGIGKTRLARELAGRVLQRFPDGVWLVDLAPISDPEQIPQAVAMELKLGEQRGQAAIDTLVAHLRDRTQLLVLDNCERLPGPSADLALSLLRGCRRLKILATSRERFRVSGEQVWQVSPLSVPDAAASFVELQTFEAMRLLLDRATHVRADFRLSESNARALVQICQRLDGIPLALELAAAGMGSCPLTEIAARLEDGFSILATDQRGRPARHRTWQACLEWSHRLLDRPERVLFRRLGVFRGRFDLEAVRAICTAPRDRAHAARLVGRLVDKSVVLADPADRGHFRLLETMRHFARSRAEAAGEANRLGRKHAEHFLTLVEADGGRLRPTGAMESLAGLKWNTDNIRAAFEWARANDGRMLARRRPRYRSPFSSLRSPL